MPTTARKPTLDFDTILMNHSWHNIMRNIFFTWLFGGLLLTTSHLPLQAQTTPPPPAPEKTEPKTEPKAEPAKAQPKAEPPKTDETTYVIPYGLAAIAVVVVMVLVCTPARRE